MTSFFSIPPSDFLGTSILWDGTKIIYDTTACGCCPSPTETCENCLPNTAHVFYQVVFPVLPNVDPCQCQLISGMTFILTDFSGSCVWENTFDVGDCHVQINLFRPSHNFWQLEVIISGAQIWTYDSTSTFGDDCSQPFSATIFPAGDTCSFPGVSGDAMVTPL